MSDKQGVKKVIQDVEFSVVCNFLIEAIVKISFEDLISWLNQNRQNWLEKKDLVGKFFYLIPINIREGSWNFMQGRENMIYLITEKNENFIVVTEEKSDEMTFNFSNDGSSISCIKNHESGLWTITLELSEKFVMYGKKLYEVIDRYFQISNNYN